MAAHYISGTGFANYSRISNERRPMGQEDVAAGKIKQAKGKLNDIAGAVTGDTGQQIKGKIEKGVGKVQEEMGKATKPQPADDR
jgi:uncharacterized protein YjbJ (UPF0337 family)